MSWIKTRKPSPALGVAVIALLVALSGTAYAAVNLPAHSVGTKQLKNGAVTITKIAASAQKALKPRAFALVSGSGTLTASSGISGSVSHSPDSGVYVLTLRKSAPRCAAIAGENPRPHSDITGGVAQASISGKHLTVVTQYYGGSSFGVSDEPFSVVVDC